MMVKIIFMCSQASLCHTEFYESVELRRGDSAYDDATMGHNLISASPAFVTILWLTSLP